MERTLDLPDLAYVRRSLPIAAVAKELGLRVESPTKIHCWHPERHQNGDRTASVAIWRQHNKVKCFGCDLKIMGPLDLVMDVLQCPIRPAIDWLVSHFPIPRLAVGVHLEEQPREIEQYGHESEVGLLIRSGIWAELSPPAQRLIPVLVEFASPKYSREERTLTMSYRALMRYSGVASPNAVKHALGELEQIGWLKPKNMGFTGGKIRSTGTYSITPFSDSVYDLANATCAEFKRDIEIERQLRNEKRNQRLASFTKALPPQQQRAQQLTK